MKKIIALVILLSLPAIKAEAQVPPPVLVAVAGGSPLASTLVFTGAVGFGAFATYMIATGQHFPLCDMDGVSCEYSYPGDKAVPVSYEKPAVVIDHTPYHIVSRFGTDSIRSD